MPISGPSPRDPFFDLWAGSPQKRGLSALFWLWTGAVVAWLGKWLVYGMYMVHVWQMGTPRVGELENNVILSGFEHHFPIGPWHFPAGSTA